MQRATPIAKARASKACALCHKRKVRCDIGVSQPCSNCQSSGRECIPRPRKSRRYSPSTLLQATGSLPDSTNINEANEAGTSRSHPLHAELPRNQDESVHASYQSDNAPDPFQIATPSSISRSRDIPDTPRQAYLGRSEYVGPDARIDEELAQNYAVSRGKYATLDDSILEQQHAFDLPPRNIRSILIDNFIKICSPWMPIVDAEALEPTSGHKPSMLLLQAVFLVGSRMRSSPLEYASCEDFYRRAKTLFFLQHEQDMLCVIKALCLMQWWNPTGPEHVSLDKGSYWLRASVGLAFEIGLHRDPGSGPEASLRRLLWWTIFTRDCLISSGQGRPRAINPEDCDVRPISINDFPQPTKSAHLFVAFVQICSILGDLTQCALRNNLSHSKKATIERDLRRWTQELHPCLQLYQHHPVKKPATYDIDVRQLHVPYFTALTILYKPSSNTSAPSPVALLASSFVAGIFEDFLRRDDVRYLNSIFTFHLLIAGVTQRSCDKYSAIRALADEELRIIASALKELSRQWDSALGPLKIIQSISNDSRREAVGVTLHPQRLTPDQKAFFEPYGPEFCRKWDVLLNRPTLPESEYGVERFGAVETSVPAYNELADLAVPETSTQPLLEFNFSDYGPFLGWGDFGGNGLD